MMMMVVSKEISLREHIRLKFIHGEIITSRVVAHCLEEAPPHGTLRVADKGIASVEFLALGREAAMRVEDSVHRLMQERRTQFTRRKAACHCNNASIFTAACCSLPTFLPAAQDASLLQTRQELRLARKQPDASALDCLRESRELAPAHVVASVIGCSTGSTARPRYIIEELRAASLKPVRCAPKAAGERAARCTTHDAYAVMRRTEPPHGCGTSCRACFIIATLRQPCRSLLQRTWHCAHAR